MDNAESLRLVLEKSDYTPWEAFRKSFRVFKNPNDPIWTTLLNKYYGNSFMKDTWYLDEIRNTSPRAVYAALLKLNIVMVRKSYSLIEYHGVEYKLQVMPLDRGGPIFSNEGVIDLTPVMKTKPCKPLPPPNNFSNMRDCNHFAVRYHSRRMSAWYVFELLSSSDVRFL